MFQQLLQKYETIHGHKPGWRERKNLQAEAERGEKLLADLMSDHKMPQDRAMEIVNDSLNV